MSEYSILENPSATLWNSFLNKFPEGNFEQCFENGEIYEMGFPKTKTTRLAITRNKKPIGVVQGTYSSYFGFGMNLGVMRGPVVNAKNSERFRVAEILLKALEDHSKKNRIIQTHIFVPEAWQLHSVFDKLGYTSAGKINEYVVNLEKGADEVWRNISHNKRRNVKKAMKEEVEVISSRNHDDLLTFYRMLGASEKRRSFSSYPLSWFEAVWKIYKPGELSKVFLARWKGKEVSGVFVVIHGKTVYALAAGSLKEGWTVRPNDIMHWKVMEWASQNGYSNYQMGLVHEPPATEGSSAWGIWRWKREWKGTLKRFEIFNRVFLPRYRLVLKTKELLQRGYTGLTRLK